MLSVREISGDELYPVWQWDERDADDPYPKTDWDTYVTKYSQPRFCHYGIFKCDILAGCLTVELWSQTEYEAHVSSSRHLLTPQEMRSAVIAVKNAAARNGVKRFFCFIPNYLRAARRLALACGLKRTKEYGTVMEYRNRQVTLICYEARQ